MGSEQSLDNVVNVHVKLAEAIILYLIQQTRRKSETDHCCQPIDLFYFLVSTFKFVANICFTLLEILKLFIYFNLHN